MSQKYFLLYYSLLLFHLKIVQTIHHDIVGITKMLAVDGLPDPYEIDLSKLNMTDSFFEGKETKVVGGVEVPMHYFPFQTALYIYYGHANSFCGGSLITQNYVLTAAHCVRSPQYIMAVLGAFDLARNEAEQVRLYAIKYTYHSQWNTNTLQNDIAVVRLPNPVKYTVAIRPVKLPTYEDDYENWKVMVVGWGKTSDYSDTTTRLRYVQTKIISNEECSRHFPFTTYTQICTDTNRFVGPCNGDSGGPLVYEGTQLGIVSFGGSSCTAGLPAVFTKLSSFLKWISANTDAKVN